MLPWLKCEASWAVYLLIGDRCSNFATKAVASSTGWMINGCVHQPGFPLNEGTPLLFTPKNTYQFNLKVLILVDRKDNFFTKNDLAESTNVGKSILSSWRWSKHLGRIKKGIDVFHPFQVFVINTPRKNHQADAHPIGGRIYFYPKPNTTSFN